MSASTVTTLTPSRNQYTPEATVKGFEPSISCVTGKRFEPLSYTVNGSVGNRTPVLDARRNNLIRHLYYNSFNLFL